MEERFFDVVCSSRALEALLEEEVTVAWSCLGSRSAAPEKGFSCDRACSFHRRITVSEKACSTGSASLLVAPRKLR